MCGEKADLKDKKGVGVTYEKVLTVAEEEVMIPRIRCWLWEWRELKVFEI